MFDPELIVYNAGTDILDGDPLGGLKVILSLDLFHSFWFTLHIEKIIGLINVRKVNSIYSCTNSILYFVFGILVQISPDGIASRDEKVFRFARDRNIPIVMLTSGELSLSLSHCMKG